MRSYECRILPTRLEIIVTDEQAKDKKYMDSLQERGLTPVIVPANDPDHNPEADGVCESAALLQP